ncbi:Zinc finger, GRF-type [Sesbania bispinosa]|nr:Zinc finger, GRF-type [Sesbania bispinosa]
MAGRSSQSHFNDESNRANVSCDNTTGSRGKRVGGGGRNARFLNCGTRFVVCTSKTQRNPGRAFYTCALKKDDEFRCGYFDWVDEESDVIAIDANMENEAFNKD